MNERQPDLSRLRHTRYNQAEKLLHVMNYPTALLRGILAHLHKPQARTPAALIAPILPVVP